MADLKVIEGGAARPPAVLAVDRFGAPIEGDHKILFRPAVDNVFHVERVEPVLDPRAPAGLVRLVLNTGPFEVVVPAGKPVQNMIRIGQSAPPAETGPANGSGKTPPEGDPPADA